MSIVGTRPPLISETNLYEPRHKATMKYHILLGDMFYRFGLIDVPDDAKEKMKRVNSSQTRRQDLRF